MSSLTNSPGIGVAKALVEFKGSGTLTVEKSFNVDSVTDLGTGQYLINLTKAFSDDDYIVVVSTSNEPKGTTSARAGTQWCDRTFGFSQSVDSVYINSSNGAAFSDSTIISVACYGD